MSAHKQAGLGPRDIAVAIVMNLLWGLNIIAAKFAVEAAGPFTAAFLRLLVVTVVCLPFLKIVPGRLGTLIALGVLSGGGFLAVVNLSLLVSDNLAALAIAGQVAVPFSLILAVIFLGERIALPRLLGIGFTFLGVVVLVFDPGVGKEIPGLLLTALGSLMWASAQLLQRRMAGVSVLTIFAWVGLVGAIILGPLAMLAEPDRMRALLHLPLGDFGWILFSALGSTLVGHGGMAWLLQRHPVSTVSPLTLAAPIVAVVASSLIFGTVLTPTMIAGGVVAMIGVTIITLRSARKPVSVAR